MPGRLRSSALAALPLHPVTPASPLRAHLSPFLRVYLAPSVLRATHPRLYHVSSRGLHLSTVRSIPHASPSPKDAATSSSSEKDTKAVSTEKARGTRMQRVWAVVKKEALHYWHGTKLLGKEIRISARIQGKLLAGKKLTRREHRQLRRTTQDLLRLIPFSVFVIVPFMELLLPVALKLFPNMLPSTFTDSFKEEEKKRKLLKVRLEMAKFLQETIREGGIKSPDKIKESETFKEFFRKVRSTGEEPTTDEIVKVSRLFEDDLTLDNLSRPQLVSMCRYMNINAFGTDNFLRYTIRSRMKTLGEDDKVIEAEGIDSLSLSELQQACQSRGIRTIGVSEEHLRHELSQWIDLHVHRGLSGTLLVLSKAFAFNRPLPGTKKEGEGDDLMRSLRDTLASLPDTLLNETELEVSSDSASFKQRLEVLQQQEELIEDEEEQEAKEVEARRTKKEAEEELKRQEQEMKEAEEEAKKAQSEKEKADELLPEKEIEEAVAEPVQEKTDPKDVRLTTEQVTELGQALEILSAKSSVLKERTELRALMDEHKTAEETESGKPNPLAKRVKALLTKIDKQLEDYDNEVGGRLNIIKTDHEGRVNLADLESALEVIQHRPSDDQIDVLVKKLDADGDGFVPLKDVIELAEGEGLGIVVNDSDAAAELVESSSAIREEAPSAFTTKYVDSSPPFKLPPTRTTGPKTGGSASTTSPATSTPAEKSENAEKPEKPVVKEKKLKKEDVVEDN